MVASRGRCRIGRTIKTKTIKTFVCRLVYGCRTWVINGVGKRSIRNVVLDTNGKNKPDGGDDEREYVQTPKSEKQKPQIGFHDATATGDTTPGHVQRDDDDELHHSVMEIRRCDIDQEICAYLDC